MKREIKTKVYQIYFEDKWESDREWIFSLFNAHFPNYTFALEHCLWHGAKENTLHITILDDNCIGHRKCMIALKAIVKRYNDKAIIKSEVLITVSKVDAYFVKGVK